MNSKTTHLSPESDPLSGAAGGWEAPSFPVLMPDQVVRFKIVKSSKDKTKSDANRETLAVVLSTEKDYPDNKGKTLKAGFKVYKYIGLTPSNGTDDKRARTWEDIGKDLAHLLKATGDKDNSPRALYDNPSIIEGRLIDGTVGINKATASFAESNSVSFKLPA